MRFALEHGWRGSNPVDMLRGRVGVKCAHTVPKTNKSYVRKDCFALEKIDHAHLEVFSIRCRFLTVQRVRSGDGSSCIEINIIVIIIPVAQTEPVESMRIDEEGRTYNIGFLRKKAEEYPSASTVIHQAKIMIPRSSSS